MRRDTTGENRKKPSLFSILAAALAVLILLVDELPEEAVGGFGALILLAAIIALFMKFGSFLRRLAPKDTSVSDHSHDRIDHRRDLKINPRTGRAVNSTVRYAERHTPQEHWKQQLDALLANGTIDRAEYKTMLNRKFYKQ